MRRDDVEKYPCRRLEMADPKLLIELDERINAIREAMRTLTEQAAAVSGAASEARMADRIADLEQQLATLQNERDALS
jgi:polyhydroxyalkanoate synthesis regulator protein